MNCHGIPIPSGIYTPLLLAVSDLVKPDFLTTATSILQIYTAPNASNVIKNETTVRSPPEMVK